MQPPDEILKRWSEVCEASTEGPLRAVHHSHEPGRKVAWVYSGALVLAECGENEDAELFALSRTAFPLAIEALEYAAECLNCKLVTPHASHFEQFTRILNGVTT